MSIVRAGIDVQKSKFASLAIDSLSEDSDPDGDWTRVKTGVACASTSKQKVKQKVPIQGGQDGERLMSKSAKKRARKKRQKNLSESSDGKNADSATLGLSWEQEVRMRNQASADLEFQRDLERAILMSKSDAQEHVKAIEESKMAERIAVSESLLMSKTGTKKGVTLSLQEFHRGEATVSPKSPSMDPHSQLSEILTDDPLPVTPTTPKDNFFDRLSESVQKEVSREERQDTRRRPLDEKQAEELPRIAQLQDELEKRDAQIAKLQKHNELLKKALKEVKQRNQSLCKILSQGEFSTKTELIEQVEQLTTVKNELTEEVQSLHSSLEQEKSKNKSLKIELAKHLGGAKNSRTGSSS